MKKDASEDFIYCVSVNCNLSKKCLRHHSHYNFRKSINYSYFNGKKKDNEECTEFVKK